MKFSAVLCIVFFFGIHTLQAEVPDRVYIKAELANATMNLTSSQQSLNASLKLCGLQVKFCSSNLKASNISKNFTDVLDNLMTFIEQIQTMDDHQTLNLSLQALSPYDFCQFLIMRQFSSIRLFKSIIKTIQGNETKLYEFGSNITSYYVDNYMRFVILKSKDKTVMATIRQILQVFSDFGVYVKLLTAHVGNFMNLNSYLASLITSKTIVAPPTENPSMFMQQMQDIESQLVPLEKQIQSLIQIALDKIAIAELTVTSRVKRATNNQKDLQQLKNTFGVISSLNDYSLLGCPHLPDLPATGDRISFRAAVCDTKEADYTDIQNNAITNQSLITIERKDLDASTANVSSSLSERKVGATHSKPIQDVIDATVNVENAYTNYTNKLDWAIKEIRKLRLTTLTQYYATPCGGFQSYTALNLKTYGVIAGSTFDQTTIYAGIGNHTVFYIKKCPARLSTTSTGAYMSNNGVELFVSTVAGYLPNHASFYWVQVNDVTAFTHPDTVKWSAGVYPITLGRKVINGYTVIGHALYGGMYKGLYYYDSFLKTAGRSNIFEAIACATPPAQACGYKSGYIPVNVPSLPISVGVLAGVDHNSMPIYVGVAANPCGDSVDIPAKLLVELANPGVVYTCNSSSPSEVLVATGIPYILYNHKSMSWKQTTANTLGSVGIFQYTSGGKTLGYGRYNISNYIIIGKVILNAGVNNGFYGFDPVAAKYFFLPPTTAFDVISCT